VTAALAFLLIFVGAEIAPFLFFMAFVVSLVGVGLSVAGLSAGHRPVFAALGLGANALALVVALSIIGGIG
jgi:hypothetical protein